MAENKTPEFEPPQACVQRVIKAVLPDNVQIGKDAKAAFSRSAGIFIMYLTACANDFCREAKRQTISAHDVMQAIKELEFGELEEPLKEYLDQYRREASAKKQSKAMGAIGSGPVAKKEESGEMDEPDADGDGDGEADSAGIHDDGDGGVARGAGDIAHQQPSSEAAATGVSTIAPVEVGAAPEAAPGVAAEAAAGAAAMDVVQPREAASLSFEPQPAINNQSAGPVPMEEDGGNDSNSGGAGVAAVVGEAVVPVQTVAASESNVVG